MKKCDYCGKEFEGSGHHAVKKHLPIFWRYVPVYTVCSLKCKADGVKQGLFSNEEY
jgi:ribosomal protein L24E